jgi:DNA (cytosine-5)-methyltransferase 1
MTKPIAVDLFCGAGGMSLGFHNAGFNVKVAIDIDAINTTTYQRNFPNSKVLRADIFSPQANAVLENLSDKSEIDVLFGGPPCQGFSLIGKRAVDDTRNLLLFRYASLVKELQPRFFVLENVPGLSKGSMVSHLKRFLRSVTRCGYSFQNPIILNASNFGVPQRRERLFIIGARQGEKLPTIPQTLDKQVSVWDAIGDLPEVTTFTELLDNDRYLGPLGTPKNEYTQYLRGCRPYSKVRLPGLGGCRRTQHTPHVMQRFDNTLQGGIDQVSRFPRLAVGGLAPTLRAGTGPDNGSHTAPRPIHPLVPRCITTREAARLHSFPDWFEFHDTKWHGFKQVGNSVPPFLAYAVAKTIFAAL